MTLIIAASGRARHGKSEMCNAIKEYAEEHGNSAAIYDIGDMIRRECITTGRLPQVERVDMAPDQIQVLIDVGREYRAKHGKNFWISQVMDKIKEDRFDVALLPNARYTNEAKMVRNAGGHVVRVVRLNDNGTMYVSPDRDANDPSESGLDFWPADFYLMNKGGHGALVAQQAITLYVYLQGLHE